MDISWTQLWDHMTALSLDHLQALEETLAPTGLSGLTFHVLRGLADGGGHLKLTEVAVWVRHSQSGTTRLVDRMEKDGLLTRESCPEDRRVTYAVLTPKGKKALHQALPLWETLVQQRLAAPLGPVDGVTYFQLLSKMNGRPPVPRDGLCPLSPSK